jgi:hypothetical protein
MENWIYLTKQMISQEAEMMLIPTLANVIHKPQSKIKKTLFFTFDVIYYLGRAYLLR